MYYNNSGTMNFESISNLFAVETIEECYDDTINGKFLGLKMKMNWNIQRTPWKSCSCRTKRT